MEVPERTECASLVEIIRVITATQLSSPALSWDVSRLIFDDLTRARPVRFPRAPDRLRPSKTPPDERLPCAKKEQSQTLRSALEEKARRQQQPAAGGPPKPKRKMRRGQAKTISDLPQLSA